MIVLKVRVYELFRKYDFILSFRVSDFKVGVLVVVAVKRYVSTNYRSTVLRRIDIGGVQCVVNSELGLT